MDINEEDINMEELLNAIKANMAVTENIDALLASKKTEKEEINENFKLTWDNFSAVENSRKYEISLLRQYRVSIFLIKVLSTIVNNQYAINEFNNISEEVKSAIKYLKSEKEIIELIRVALNKLENACAFECNYEISLLLSYIAEINYMIIDRIGKDINISNARIKGFNISKGNKYEDDEKALDAKIQESVLKLGLKKQE